MNTVRKLMLGTATALLCALSPISALAGPMDEAKIAYGNKDYTKAYALMKPLADAGDKRAQNNIGFLYENGWGVGKSDAQAVHWYTRSARQGFPNAQHNLGSMYRRGHGTAQSDVEAAKWYRKAAAQNYADSLMNLGIMYENGQGVPQSLSTARSWYEKAQIAGAPQATNSLAKLSAREIPEQSAPDLDAYIARQTVPKKKTPLPYRGVDQAQFTAAGRVKAVLNCAEFYNKGKYDKAYKKCLKPAKNGNAVAQNNLGFIQTKRASMGRKKNSYTTSYGLEDGEDNAKTWFSRAAKQGYAVAQHDLADEYYDFFSAKAKTPDKIKAFTWYQKAAENGHAISQMALGEMYEKGNLVKRDYKKAVYWFEKSAAQGIPYAKEHLQIIYGNGQARKSDANAASAGIVYSRDVETYLNQIQVNKNWVEPGSAASEALYQKGKKLFDKWNYNVSGGGRYTHPDLISAIELFGKANEQGNAKAGYSLAFAHIYKNTVTGTKQVWLEATTWMKQSADRGNLEAQQQLAKEFLTGLNIIQSYPQAAYWNLRAAEQGDENAKMFLEFLLLSGSVTADEIPKISSGTELKKSAKELFFAGLEAGYNKNYTKAEILLLQSAKEGHVAAQAALGKMYYNGEGVPSSFENAYEWYGIAAGNGDVQSQYMMGYLWDSNATKDLALKLVLAGINVDRVLKARSWYSQAAANGHANARIKLAALSSYTPVPPPPIKRGWLEQFAIDAFQNAEQNSTRYYSQPDTSVESYVYHAPRCYNIGNGIQQCFHN